MGVLTIRGISEEMAKRLKERAKEEGASLNSVLLQIIKEALGLERKRRSITYNDLDHLAGTWSEEDYLEFHSKIFDFETVDENMWK